MVQAEQPLQIALPIIGSLLSLFYFVQKQKLEELKVFREIFTECNSRYDEVNESLAEIVESEGKCLSSVEKQILVDYFNLCGEEYLYYRHGIIDPTVWEAWANGMRAILEAPRITEHWKKEKSTGSYYGLPF